MNALTRWLSTYYDEVEPMEFYREIFPAGSMQQRGVYTQGDYNAILIAVSNEQTVNGTSRIRRYTVTDDLEAIKTACSGDDFCLMSPITYAGKNRTAENARYLHAIAVDVDRLIVKNGVPHGLMSLMERHVDLVGRVPRPTFIVSSGTGIHLYYVLEDRIALFDDTAKALQQLKHDLTDLIWHEYVVNIKDRREVQQEGIYQGFRVPGTITKTGTRAKVFRTGDKVTIDYLNGFVDQAHRVQLDQKHKPRNRMTLAQAKEKYPEWYDRRVINGSPRGAIPFSRRLYEWWKRQIMTGAVVGHRYWCLSMLAVYARKCSVYDAEKNPNPVTRGELENDAWQLMAYLEQLTTDEDNHFTADDVLKALEFFDERWLAYPRAAIEYRSGIEIPAQRRNHKKRSEHMQLVRFMRVYKNKPGGAPTKQETVQEWQRLHPNGNKAECIHDTGLSRPTVYKWWEPVDKRG